MRRSLIAVSTLALVAVGAGIAGADSRSSAQSGNEWGIDFTTLERVSDEGRASSSDALAELNVVAALDLSGWDAAMDKGRDDKGDKGDKDKNDKGPKARRTLRLRVDSTHDRNDAHPGDGRCRDADNRCTLRAAVEEANAFDGPAEITLRNGKTYLLDLQGAGNDDATTGDLDVVGDLSIKGNATIDASHLGDRVLDVPADASLALNGPDLVGGTPPTGSSGGAIRTAGDTDLKKVDISDSIVEGEGASGGAVFNAGGDLAVKNSTFSGNSATRAGGAIEANAGTTELKNVELSGNTTGAMPGNGGGLHLTGAGTVDVRDSVVSGNTAAAEGGGLWNSAVGTMTVSDTTVTGNVASGDLADNGGGALFNDGGSLTVDGSTISGNVADGDAGSGGGILNNMGDLTVERSTLANNTSNRAGGGIEANIGTTDLDRVNLVGNSTGDAPGNGGGLHLTGAGTVDITRSRVVDNVAAAEGGGLWNSSTGTMTVRDTTIRRNQAPIGPDVYNDGGTFTVDGQPVPVGG